MLFSLASPLVCSFQGCPGAITLLGTAADSSPSLVHPTGRMVTKASTPHCRRSVCVTNAADGCCDGAGNELMPGDRVSCAKGCAWLGTKPLPACCKSVPATMPPGCTSGSVLLLACASDVAGGGCGACGYCLRDMHTPANCSLLLTGSLTATLCHIQPGMHRARQQRVSAGLTRSSRSACCSVAVPYGALD